MVVANCACRWTSSSDVSLLTYLRGGLYFVWSTGNGRWWQWHIWRYSHYKVQNTHSMESRLFALPRDYKTIMFNLLDYESTVALYENTQGLLRKGNGGRLPPMWAKGDNWNCPWTNEIVTIRFIRSKWDNHTFTLSSQTTGELINDAAFHWGRRHSFACTSPSLKSQWIGIWKIYIM